MPNTPVRRLENCCMPPKKSAWRYDNVDLSEHPPHSAESKEIYSRKMGLMSGESKMKPVSQMQFYPSVDLFSHGKHGKSEEAPLDFSVKKVSDSRSKTESIRHFNKPHENYGGSNLNQPPIQLIYPTKMVNGNNSTPSPRNNSPTNTSQASLSSKDSDSLDMDCSQGSLRSPHSTASCVNKMNDIYLDQNSPEHQNLSRGNTPTSQTSILEGMLRGQQQSNGGLSDASRAFGIGYGNGLTAFDGQVISSSSPPVAMNAPLMHPAAMLPLTMAPYFGYGYVEHPNPFMSGYMCNPAESNMDDVSAGRKPRRKLDPFSDSLKTYSVDELKKKLELLSGGSSIAINPESAINSRLSCSPHERSSRHFSNNPSPEPVKNVVTNGANKCAATTKGENGEKGNTSYNQIDQSHNRTNNAIINHGKENGTVTPNIEQNEINCQSTMDLSEMNSANIAGGEDVSVSIAIPESSLDGRRRKSIPDYKEDPQYRLKRAKNNLAARRSRESRRLKEELIRKTATVLEQQNKVIMRDFTALKFSFDEAQVKYFSLLKEYENMKIQNSVLAERLNQKRCGQCGTALPNVS